MLSTLKDEVSRNMNINTIFVIIFGGNLKKEKREKEKEREREKRKRERKKEKERERERERKMKCIELNGVERKSSMWKKALKLPFLLQQEKGYAHAVQHDKRKGGHHHHFRRK